MENNKLLFHVLSQLEIVEKMQNDINTTEEDVLKFSIYIVRQIHAYFLPKSVYRDVELATIELENELGNKNIDLEIVSNVNNLMVYIRQISLVNYLFVKKNTYIFSKEELLHILSPILYHFQYIVVYEKRNSLDLFLNKNNKSLDSCIKKIEIHKYKNLNNIEVKDIPVDSQFIVFTGNNSEGKTNILQAIAVGVHGHSYGSYLWADSKDFSVLICAKQQDKNIVYTAGYKYFYPMAINNQITKVNNLCAYGASRLQLQSPESQSNIQNRQSPIHGLFRADSILLNIDVWLREQKVRGNESLVEAVKKILIKLMPSVNEIKIGIAKDYYPIQYLGMDNEALSSENLSAGNKSILAMIGDMMIRLYQQQPEVVEVSDLQGIVLIDELETHLHPKWQLKLSSLLAECFPKVQFIVTTHSPIIVLGMPENTVYYNVNKDKGETTVEKVDIDVSNLLPNQVLTSPIFNMESILSVQNKNIGEVRTENTFDEIKQRDEVRKKLREIAEKLQQKL